MLKKKKKKFTVDGSSGFYGLHRPCKSSGW